MDDSEIMHRIGLLADEERSLERSLAPGEGIGDSARRLHDIAVARDRWWDLLRQRRARREAGQDPERAAPRSASTLDGYQQ